MSAAGGTRFIVASGLALALVSTVPVARADDDASVDAAPVEPPNDAGADAGEPCPGPNDELAVCVGQSVGTECMLSTGASGACVLLSCTNDVGGPLLSCRYGAPVEDSGCCSGNAARPSPAASIALAGVAMIFVRRRKPRDAAKRR